MILKIRVYNQWWAVEPDEKVKSAKAMRSFLDVNGLPHPEWSSRLGWVFSKKTVKQKTAYRQIRDFTYESLYNLVINENKIIEKTQEEVLILS